jgi:hypothetical protein
MNFKQYLDERSLAPSRVIGSRDFNNRMKDMHDKYGNKLNPQQEISLVDRLKSKIKQVVKKGPLYIKAIETKIDDILKH